jgi:hypothetical protein
MKKEICRNKETKDFDMYLDLEYVGSQPTPQEAREELDRLAFEQLRRAN